MAHGIGWGRVLLLVGSLTTSTRAGATGGMPDLSPLALSPAERSAVVADADGALHLVHAGEPLPGGAGTLVEVLADRLVVDLVPGPPAEAGEDAAGDRSTAPLRVWIYPPERPGMPSRIQPLDPRPPDGLPAERLLVPETVPERLPEGARVGRPPAPPPEAGGDPPARPEPAAGGGGAHTERDSTDTPSTAAASRREAAAGGDR